MTGPPAFDAPLPRSFYDRPTVRVARALLGTVLVRLTPSGPIAARVVETEAYIARDPANHAFGGPTPRNRSMFAGPGTLYVYRIHQVHCANAVTRKGEAVLLRAAEPLLGPLGDLRGPGRLCRGFGLTRAEDGTDLVGGPVRLLPGRRGRARIVVGPRVGIRKAVDWPLRFALEENRWVSRPRPGGRGASRG